MINEIIDEIVLAEETADAKKKEAEQEAKNITLSTASEIEKIKKQFYDETKSEIDTIMAFAKKDADVAFDERIKLAENEAKETIKIAERNLPKASEYVLDVLLGKKN